VAKMELSLKMLLAAFQATVLSPESADIEAK
jgi:hypothetical protein